jgi:hypothetical protein
MTRAVMKITRDTSITKVQIGLWTNTRKPPSETIIVCLKATSIKGLRTKAKDQGKGFETISLDQIAEDSKGKSDDPIPSLSVATQ